MGGYEMPINSEEMYKRTGYSRQKVWDLQTSKSHERFPKAISRNKWLWSEIQQWQANMIAARNPVDIEAKKREMLREVDLAYHDLLMSKLSEVRLRLVV